MRIVHRNRLLDWIESITTTYSDVQFSGSTIKTITRTQLKVTLHSNYTARGGALGYILGGYVPPGTPNWLPVLNKNSPKIDTPFKKWANFLYPVLEFALKLIPRSRNGPNFYTPF